MTGILRGAALALAATLVASQAGAAAAAPRVVSLDQCADQYVLALAPRDEIVALSKRATNADSYLRAEAAGLPQQRQTLEAVLGSGANLAVYNWTTDLSLPAALSRHGLTVVKVDDAHDFATVRADIRKVAAALGQSAAGEALIARMDAKLAASQGAWRGARALYLTPGGFTAGPGTMVGAMMSAAGLSNAAPGPDYAAVSLESLVLNPPVALVLGFFRDLAGGRSHWTIGGSSYLQALARQRAIASLPGSMLGCPAWFAADGTLALAKARPGA
ncbi:MAG TPA: ABC transporter substrate-binding protein [Caulobacteraceae bacterium]